MYSEVSAIFNQPTVVQHFERSWVPHTKMKVRSNTVKLGQTWSKHGQTSASCKMCVFHRCWCSGFVLQQC
jgi:hypothetical protein